LVVTRGKGLIPAGPGIFEGRCCQNGARTVSATLHIQAVFLADAPNVNEPNNSLNIRGSIL